ncbi:hypothetical protein A3Q56_04282 [Intoshia linei]|uniref:RdRp catalytic domain-containing protein n=1 Tax=Intoshia linei TaxID=1819745 RepID=A0A177B2N5_9BILA|nr:hypothetical protein A3Q56_04282 [Intoshia linei]
MDNNDVEIAYLIYIYISDILFSSKTYAEGTGMSVKENDHFTNNPDGRKYFLIFKYDDHPTGHVTTLCGSSIGFRSKLWQTKMLAIANVERQVTLFLYDNVSFSKDRELKRMGRFFALMSFKLGTYFVLTELLLSKFIVLPFGSLTMVDNLNKVFKNMMRCVPGHGNSNNNLITFAYHLHYEKWNNHQRYESTAPNFEVIDKLDLIKIDSDLNVHNKSGKFASCNGQLIGLEGLRQKEWSVVSLLMIEYETSNRNVSTKILAQGNNQIICLTYKN